MHGKTLLSILVILAFACFTTGCGGGGSSDSGDPTDDDAADDDTSVDDDTDDDSTDDDSSDDDSDDDATDDDDADDDTGDDDADDDTGDDDTTPCPDSDGDGYDDAACGGEDCDDADDAVHPGAIDVCGDDIDNDCDDTVDNPENPPVDLPGFLLGVCGSGGDPKVLLPELGIEWHRPTFSWISFEPTITDPDLTLADIEADPTIIDDYIDAKNWTGIDANAKSMHDAGLTLMPIVGHGYTTTLPYIDGDRATPDRLGREQYLAQQYREVRALVERYDGDGYKDATDIVIKFWQTENELNQAMLTGIYGWRSPEWFDAFTSAWADWDFITELLATLYRAVHDADPEAITTQNLHTDIHPNYSALLGQPSWIDAATLWRDHVDLMGFDAYPNYYVAEPVMGEVVGERAETIAEASCGKPVIAMEIGYPKGPVELGFSADLQADFIDEAFHAAFDAGVVGYFHFGLQSGDSDSVDITPDDIAALAAIGPDFTDGRILPVLAYLIAHPEVIDPHFLDVLQSVESYWGVVHNDGTHQPGFDVLADIAVEVDGL